MKVKVVRRVDGYYVAYDYGALVNLRFGPYSQKKVAQLKALEAQQKEEENGKDREDRGSDSDRMRGGT